MTYKEVISFLKENSNPQNVEGMAKFGISTENALGISIPILRKLAKDLGKNHKLALDLWQSKIHEARILACLIDDYKQVTKIQMDNWVNEFDSWDICDQVCGNLFDKTPFAFSIAKEWVKKDKEFIRRAGFVIMAELAVHDKSADDQRFIDFLPYIEKYSDDNRNFVKKAVNWSLRQIGKRNDALKVYAIESAEKISQLPSKSARWIAADALRELKKI